MLQRFAGGLRDLVDILLHAPADIEQQNNIQPLLAVRERNDALRQILIGHDEVVLGQPIDEILSFGDLNIHSNVGYSSLEHWRRRLLRGQRR